MKGEFDKLNISKLINVSTSLNNFKTKVHDLDVGKLKAVPVDLKKLSDIVDNEVVKNTKFDRLKTKVNNLEKKTPNATTLIHVSQYNTDQNIQCKKLEMVIKIVPDANGLVTTTVLNTKISEVRNKLADTSSLVKFLIMTNILLLLNLIS